MSDMMKVGLREQAAPEPEPTESAQNVILRLDGRKVTMYYVADIDWLVLYGDLADGPQYVRLTKR